MTLRTFVLVLGCACFLLAGVNVALAVLLDGGPFVGLNIVSAIVAVIAGVYALIAWRTGP